MMAEPQTSLRIAEVVLRTSRYDQMRAWYVSVLEIDPYYEHLPRMDALEGVDDGSREPSWASRSREFKRNPSGLHVDADAVTALICARSEPP